MKRWILGIVSVVLVLLLSLAGNLYFYGGLKQYVRATSVINNLPEEDKNLGWQDLKLTDAREGRGGILAGTWFGKVWTWSADGLQAYAVDDYSIYSFFDGCSDEPRSRLKRGERNAITRSIYKLMDDWRTVVKPGDYVVVYLAQPEEGWVTGNLREIYGYNFWLFLKRGIDIQCAK